MAAKLGSGDVSFRLGSATPAAVYLGATQVWSAVPPEPATLYFYDPAVNANWDNAGVWWLNEEHTSLASFSPRNGDDLVLLQGVSLGGPRTMRNLTVVSAVLSVNATVTGVATFASDSQLVNGTVTGDAVFNGSDNTAGIIDGNATFNGASSNSGTVTGDATFNDSSSNDNSVGGDATFNDSSSNDGDVVGTATFNDESCQNYYATAGSTVPDPPPSC